MIIPVVYPETKKLLSSLMNADEGIYSTHKVSEKG
jgi:hypothetical protein